MLLIVNFKLNRWRIFKPVVFLACLAPAVWLACAAFTDRLGANPLAEITNTTGLWTLRLLCVTLAISPLRRITGWNSLIRFRRMLGIFAFFYAVLHFIRYIWLDQVFDFGGMLADVRKRPFITAGFLGFVVLIPLAVTSTQKWIERLGGKRWQMLHRLIYVSAAAGVIHYLWLVKLDTRRPLAYGAVLAVLLGFRVWIAVRSRLSVRPEDRASRHA